MEQVAIRVGVTMLWIHVSGLGFRAAEMAFAVAAEGCRRGPIRSSRSPW